MKRERQADDKAYVVSRIENDDGTYNAQPEYLRLEKPYGNFFWDKHAAHASKMTFLNAVMLSQLCRLGGDEYDEPPARGYSYGVSDAYRG